MINLPSDNLPESASENGIDPERLRVWLLPRLSQPNVTARLTQFRAIHEELAPKHASWLSEADLTRVWIDLNNGVSELPSTSGNLAAVNRPMILRSAALIAQTLSESPGTRLVGLHRFFKTNGESIAQLPHYVRTVALYDPAHAPTVTAYRGLPTALSTLGYTGDVTPWERLIQTGQIAELDAAIAFVFQFIKRALPDGDQYERAIGLELLPGYVKGFQRLTIPHATPIASDRPIIEPRPSRDAGGDRPFRRPRSGPPRRA